jgi:transposase
LRRYALSDDQFARIEHLLPGRPGHVGRNSDKGNRLFVEAVIWKFSAPARPGAIFPSVLAIGRTLINDFPDGPKAAFGRVLAQKIEPAALLADKGYDTDGFIEHLEVRRIKPVIPPRANRKTPRECDFALYCERNLVERFFNIMASTFAPSQPATKRLPETSSQASTSSAPWLGSNDDRP